MADLKAILEERTCRRGGVDEGMHVIAARNFRCWWLLGLVAVGLTAVYYWTHILKCFSSAFSNIFYSK